MKAIATKSRSIATFFTTAGCRHPRASRGWIAAAIAILSCATQVATAQCTPAQVQQCTQDCDDVPIKSRAQCIKSCEARCPTQPPPPPPAPHLHVFYTANTDVHYRVRNPDGTWSADQLTSAYGVVGKFSAALLPGTSVLQVFYRGTDNGLWVTSQNSNGSWSLQNLGGVLNGAPVAAQVPGANRIQVFFRGADWGLHTRSQNPDGSLSSDQNLGGSLNGDPIAVQVPGTNILQMLYQATDQSLRSRWRNPDGSWSPEQNLGGHLSSNPFAAQIPGTNVLQVFYAGTDGGLWSRWRNSDGTWSNEQGLGGALTGDPIAAQVPATDILAGFL